MASVELPARRTDWALARPWSWMLVALIASGAAFLCARVLGQDLSGLRFLLLGLGLVGVSAALCQRFQPGIEGGATRLGPRTLLAVAAVVGLAALAASVLLFLKLANPDGGLPWQTGSVVFFWVLTAPWCAFLAVFFIRRLDGTRVSQGMEGAALLVMAALVAFLSCWALYLPDSSEDWDSMRVFFAGAVLAALVASVLVAASQGVRRFLFSVLIVLHFGGILTAVMVTDPGPLLAKVAWIRFYRPYLEFMYLVNAYRFYSPEPNAATQFWFYVEYEKPEAARWIKLPDLGEDGNPRYPLRLRYQRRLAFTENLTRPDVATAFEYVDPFGNKRQSAFWVRRDEQSPNPTVPKGLLGAKQVDYKLGQAVPYHPNLVTQQQYIRPNAEAKQLLRSATRHLLGQPHPQFPGLKAKSVKIYRVLHETLLPQQFAAGFDPNLLTYFYPFYQGQYDREGILLDPEDPFLYWLLPTLTETADPTVQPQLAQPNVLNVYAILHALGGKKQAQERWKVRVHDNRAEGVP